jgi:hypothetical protein
MSLGSALKRSWSVVLACVVLCTGVAAVTGLLRHPEYKAEARLFVGSLDVRSLAVPGYVLASQQLAAAYSRVAVSSIIEVPVARRSGFSRKQVGDRLSAADIPQSPVVRLRATGPNEDDAVKLVRAATTEMAAYVTKVTSRNAEADELFKRYRAAAERAQALEARAALLRAQDAPERARVDAQTRAETARLNASTVAQLYGQARATSAGAAQVQTLDAGQSATNDRGEVLQRLVLLGLASGLVLGAALASLRLRALVRQG